MLCKSRFFISNANAFYKDADAKCPYDAHVLLLEVQFSWCKCPMQGCRCKFYPWWCQRTYLIVMQMSLCRDGDAKNLMVQMPSNGYVDKGRLCIRFNPIYLVFCIVYHLFWTFWCVFSCCRWCSSKMIKERAKKA